MNELDLSSPEALEASLKKAPPKKAEPKVTKAEVVQPPAGPDPRVTVAWLNERNGEISRRRICYSCKGDVCGHGWVELVKR